MAVVHDATFNAKITLDDGGIESKISTIEGKLEKLESTPHKIKLELDKTSAGKGFHTEITKQINDAKKGAKIKVGLELDKDARKLEKLFKGSDVSKKFKESLSKENASALESGLAENSKAIKVFKEQKRTLETLQKAYTKASLNDNFKSTLHNLFYDYDEADDDDEAEKALVRFAAFHKKYQKEIKSFGKDLYKKEDESVLNVKGLKNLESINQEFLKVWGKGIDDESISKKINQAMSNIGKNIKNNLSEKDYLNKRGYFYDSFDAAFSEIDDVIEKENSRIVNGARVELNVGLNADVDGLMNQIKSAADNTVLDVKVKADFSEIPSSLTGFSDAIESGISKNIKVDKASELRESLEKSKKAYATYYKDYMEASEKIEAGYKDYKKKNKNATKGEYLSSLSDKDYSRKNNYLKDLLADKGEVYLEDAAHAEKKIKKAEAELKKYEKANNIDSNESGITSDKAIELKVKLTPDVAKLSSELDGLGKDRNIDINITANGKEIGLAFKELGEVFDSSFKNIGSSLLQPSDSKNKNGKGSSLSDRISEYKAALTEIASLGGAITIPVEFSPELSILTSQLEVFLTQLQQNLNDPIKVRVDTSELDQLTSQELDKNTVPSEIKGSTKGVSKERSVDVGLNIKNVEKLDSLVQSVGDAFTRVNKIDSKQLKKNVDRAVQSDEEIQKLKGSLDEAISVRDSGKEKLKSQKENLKNLQKSLKQEKDDVLYEELGDVLSKVYYSERKINPRTASRLVALAEEAKVTRKNSSIAKMIEENGGFKDFKISSPEIQKVIKEVKKQIKGTQYDEDSYKQKYQDDLVKKQNKRTKNTQKEIDALNKSIDVYDEAYQNDAARVIKAREDLANAKKQKTAEYKEPERKKMEDALDPTMYSVIKDIQKLPELMSSIRMNLDPDNNINQFKSAIENLSNAPIHLNFDVDESLAQVRSVIENIASSPIHLNIDAAESLANIINTLNNLQTHEIPLHFTLADGEIEQKLKGVANEGLKAAGLGDSAATASIQKQIEESVRNGIKAGLSGDTLKTLKNGFSEVSEAASKETQNKIDQAAKQGAAEYYKQKVETEKVKRERETLKKLNEFTNGEELKKIANNSGINVDKDSFNLDSKGIMSFTTTIDTGRGKLETFRYEMKAVANELNGTGAGFIVAENGVQKFSDSFLKNGKKIANYYSKDLKDNYLNKIQESFNGKTDLYLKDNSLSLASDGLLKLTTVQEQYNGKVKETEHIISDVEDIFQDGQFMSSMLGEVGSSKSLIKAKGNLTDAQLKSYSKVLEDVLSTDRNYNKGSLSIAPNGIATFESSLTNPDGKILNFKTTLEDVSTVISEVDTNLGATSESIKRFMRTASESKVKVSEQLSNDLRNNYLDKIQGYYQDNTDLYLKDNSLSLSADGLLKLTTVQDLYNGKLKETEYLLSNVESVFKNGEFLPSLMDKNGSSKTSIKARGNLTNGQIDLYKAKLATMENGNVDESSIKVFKDGSASFVSQVEQMDGSVLRLKYHIADVREEFAGLGGKGINPETNMFTPEYLESGINTGVVSDIKALLKTYKEEIKAYDEVEAKRRAVSDNFDNNDFNEILGEGSGNKLSAQLEKQSKEALEKVKKTESLIKNLLSSRDGLAMDSDGKLSEQFNSIGDSIVDAYIPSDGKMTELATKYAELKNIYSQLQANSEDFIHGMGKVNKEGKLVNYDTLMNNVGKDLNEFLRRLTTGDYKSENDLMRLLTSAGQAMNKLDTAVFQKNSSRLGSFIGGIDPAINARELRSKLEQAIYNMADDTVDVQVKQLKKDSREAKVQYRQGNEVKKATVRLEDMISQTNNGDRQIDGAFLKVDSSEEYRTPFQKWTQGVKSKINTLSQYMTGMEIVQRAFQEVREGFQFVSSMDSALTTINQTMGVSKQQLNDLGKGAIQVGTDLSTGAENVMDAVAVYANANETTESILEKSKPTVMLSNASGMATTEASSVIQAVTNQFKELEGQENRIVNSYEKISAGLAIDFKDGIIGMSEAVQTSGSIAAEAGLSFEKYSAIVGKIQETTRLEGSQIGNTLKTTMARLSRSASADPDVTAEDRSKAAAAYKSMGIDLYNDKGEYANLDDTLSTLASRWDTLTDAQKNYIAEQSAGTRGINVFNAMMSTYADAMKLAEEAMSDTDFIDETQDKYEQSIAAHGEELKVRMQQIWSNLLPADEVTGLMSVGSVVLDIISKIVEGVTKIGDSISFGHGSLFTALATGFGGMKVFDSIRDYTNESGLSLFEAFKGNFSGVGSVLSKIIPSFKSSDGSKSFSNLFNSGLIGLVKNGTSGFFGDFLGGFKEGKKSFEGLEKTAKKSLEGVADAGEKNLTKVAVKSAVAGEAAEAAMDVASDVAKESVKKSFASKAGTVIGSLLTPNIIAAALAGLGLASVAGIGMYLSSKNSRENVNKRNEEMYQENLSKQKEFTDTSAYLESITDEYKQLSAGVDTKTNKNISLTNDEFARYNELTSELAQRFPTLVKGYDLLGNAILTNGNALKLANDQLELDRYEQAQKNLDNYNSYAQGWALATSGRKITKDTAQELRENQSQREENIVAMEKGVVGDISAKDRIDAYNKLIGLTYNDLISTLKGEKVNGKKLLSEEQKKVARDYFGGNPTEETWEMKRSQLASKIAKEQAEIDRQAANLRSAYSSAVEVLRYNKEFKGKTTETNWENLQNYMAGLGSKDLDALTNMGLDPNSYVSNWVEALSSGAAASKVSSALSNMLTINDTSTLSQLKDFIQEDIPTLQKSVRGFDGNNFLESVGLSNISELESTIKKYDLAANRFATTQNELNKTERNRKNGTQGTGLVDGSQLMFTNTGKSGKQFNDKQLDEYLNQYFATGKDPEQLILDRFYGKNAEKQMKKSIKAQKDGAKAMKVTADQMRKVMDELGIKTDDEISKLLDLFDAFKNEKDPMKKASDAFKMDNFDLNKEIEKINALRANLENVEKAYQTMGEAKKASFSSSGMNKSQIDSLSALYQDLDGYDYDKLFESTARGVKLNTQEMEKLNKAWSDKQAKKYADQLDYLIDKYNDYNKKIAEAKDNTVKKNELVGEREDLRQRIREMQEVQSMYEGISNSVATWERSLSEGEQGDLYDAITGAGREGAKKRYEAHEIGTNEFKSFANMLTYEDLTGKSVDKYVEAYEKSQPYIDRWFGGEARDNLNNFFTDMQKVNKGFADIDKNGNWVLNKGNHDIHEMAKAMDIDVALLETMFDKVKDLGGDITFTEFSDYMKSVRDSAISAFGQIDDATKKKYKLDLDKTDLDGVEKQIDQIDKAIEANADNPELLNKLQTLKDYYQELLGEILAENPASKTQKQIEDAVAMLDKFNKKYETDIKINVNTDDPAELRRNMEELVNGAYEKRKDQSSDGKLTSKDKEFYQSYEEQRKQLVKNTQNADWYYKGNVLTDPNQQDVFGRAQNTVQKKNELDSLFLNADKVKHDADTYIKALNDWSTAKNKFDESDSQIIKNVSKNTGLNKKDLNLDIDTNNIENAFGSVDKFKKTLGELSNADKLDLKLDGIEDMNDALECLSKLDAETQKELLVRLGLEGDDSFIKAYDKIKELREKGETVELKTIVNAEEWETYTPEQKEAIINETLGEELELEDEEADAVYNAVVNGDAEEIEDLQKMLSQVKDKKVVVKAVAQGKEAVKKLNKEIDATKSVQKKVAPLTPDTGIQQDISTKYGKEAWTQVVRFTADTTAIEDMTFDNKMALVEYLADTGALTDLPIEDVEAFVDYLLGDVQDITPEDKQALVDYLTGKVETLPKQEESGEIDYKNIVEKLGHQYGTGEINYINNWSLPSIPNITKTVTWQNVGSTGGAGSVPKKRSLGYSVEMADGTAHVNGTAFANGTVSGEITTTTVNKKKKKKSLIKTAVNKARSAFAMGNWGAKKSETALVGEVGSELRIKAGTSEWELLGEHGAEFRDIQKGDIIFNHFN